MLDINEIKQIEFEMPENIMTVTLKKERVIDGINTDKIRVKTTLAMFTKKLEKLNKHKGLI